MSILYAKAETLRTSKTRQDRQTRNQKAHSTAAPTIIFQSPIYLKYFLDHVSIYLQGVIPSFLIGHSEDVTAGPTTAMYKDTPSTIGAFMKNKTFTRYLSNIKDDGYKSLILPSQVDTPTAMELLSSADRLISAARKLLSQEQFHEAFKQLVKTHWPDSDSITSDISDMRLGTTRYPSPKRKLSSDVKTPRSTLLRRTNLLPLRKQSRPLFILTRPWRRTIVLDGTWQLASIPHPLWGNDRHGMGIETDTKLEPQYHMVLWLNQLMSFLPTFLLVLLFLRYPSLLYCPCINRHILVSRSHRKRLATQFLIPSTMQWHTYNVIPKLSSPPSPGD